jgi:TatD DNase family protein
LPKDTTIPSTFNVAPAPHTLVDIGANLTHESFAPDLIQVMKRARDANVRQMVVTGSDMQESRKAIALASAYPQWLTATAGIHPHYASVYDTETHQQLLDMIGAPEVRAVGETGLDYFRDISPRDSQQKSFIAHLALAADAAKPVFLHQREAHDNFLAILREHRSALTNVVVHCFTDSRDALQDYLQLDCHIGITGWICDERRGSHLLDCVAEIPLDRLMLETDAPYLLARTIRPKPKTRRNEPCTLPEVLRVVAEARGESETELARATTANAQTFFSLRTQV